MANAHFSDPNFARRYLEPNSPFVPCYDGMTRLAGQLIEERVPRPGAILVVGAGGGRELAAFARRRADWSFVAVDPSAEMLAIAQQRAPADGFEGRTDYVVGIVDDAPPGPFDAASCLLVQHFIPDDGSKLAMLRAIRSRLNPGAPFVSVALCIDLHGPDAETALARYRRYALDSGESLAEVDKTCGRVRTELHMVRPERDAALIAEAGFADVELFYAALSWRGWRATA